MSAFRCDCCCCFLYCVPIIFFLVFSILTEQFPVRHATAMCSIFPELNSLQLVHTCSHANTRGSALGTHRWNWLNQRDKEGGRERGEFISIHLCRCGVLNANTLYLTCSLSQNHRHSFVACRWGFLTHFGLIPLPNILRSYKFVKQTVLAQL